MPKSFQIMLILTLIASATHSAEAQTTWHVDDDCAPPGAGSERDPFCRIQDGVNSASDGDSVLVAPGTYTGERNRDISLFGKRITLASSEGAATTILDIQGSPSSIHRGFFLIHGETRETIIEGFTIENGYLIGNTGGSGDGGGGAGIYLRSSSPTIRYCSIQENNSATFGNPFISDGRGGGILVDDHSIALIENCTIALNHSGKRGGGLFIGYENSSVTIQNCLVSGNSSAGNFPGGGIQNTFGCITVINTAIVNNGNNSFAGGMYNEGSEAFLHNCVVWGNSAIVGTQVYVDGFAVLAAEYSDIQEGLAGVEGPGEIVWGEGMIDADPLFVDPENGDFRISAGSPCIDAGNDWAISSGLITDLGGLARFAEDPATTDTGVAAWGVGVVDMGAYEFGGDDCNGNGTPDVEDIANRDSTDCTANNIPDECEPDCNGSGQADSCDIADESSTDCDHDGRPDECQIEIDSVPGGPFYCDPTLQTCDLDCNANGQPDACDISSGADQDCGVDGIPDDCPENPGPIITAQPADAEVEVGDFVFFNVQADGVQLEYQWRKDGADLVDTERILGTNSPLLLILDVQPGDAGEYDCMATDFSGACSLSNPATLSVTDSCPADFDDDGTVGASDLAFLLGAWGPCPDPDACPADLDADGTVAAPDLALLLGNWGPCP